MKNRVVVGLTGIFGSGKTTVSHLMEELGAAVINADHLAHEALWKDSAVYAGIRKLFPEVPEDAKGLDRKKLGAIVFKDEKRRKDLEKEIHPYVRQRVEAEIADAEEKVVVLEVPLLFEANFDWLCDTTVTVEASREEVEKRLMEKGFSKEEIEARLKAQMPLEEKKKRSKFIINNNGSLEKTRAEVEKIWQEFKRLA
jgi:dephospho-CoA kinase